MHAPVITGSERGRGKSRKAKAGQREGTDLAEATHTPRAKALTEKPLVPVPSKNVIWPGTKAFRLRNATGESGKKGALLSEVTEGAGWCGARRCPWWPCFRTGDRLLESKAIQCNLQRGSGIIAQRRKTVIGGIFGSIGL